MAQKRRGKSGVAAQMQVFQTWVAAVWTEESISFSRTFIANLAGERWASKPDLLPEYLLDGRLCTWRMHVMDEDAFVWAGCTEPNKAEGWR